MNDVAQDAPTIVEADAQHQSAKTYLQRTREVLTTQWKEASKVQADTRSGLLEVWRDLQTDLRDQYSTLEDSAKRQTRTLWNKLPFTGSSEKDEEASTESEAAKEGQAP